MRDSFAKGWLTGFEPATSGTTIQRSNQLSYSHHVIPVKGIRYSIWAGALIPKGSKSVISLPFEDPRLCSNQGLQQGRDQLSYSHHVIPTMRYLLLYLGRRSNPERIEIYDFASFRGSTTL